MNIYFSGIGGVGIGPLAQIALGAGYRIFGSDSSDSALVQDLSKEGVAISLSQDGDFLRKIHDESPIDWLVYTSALPYDHPELVVARELGIHTSKRDEFLSNLISKKGLKLIAVAGTHGKTTATGMFVWALKALGVPVSYSIGTTVSFGPSGSYDPKSDFFIYECDEFDKNFLNFSPYLSITTSFDYDHPDTYPAQSDYVDAFRQYSKQCDRIITWEEDVRAIDETCLEKTQIIASDDVVDINLPGRHNRKNATLVVKAIEELGLATESEAIRAVESFPGTDRRFERLSDNVYSDYGHHPVEITATLAMAKEIGDKITLVYQPHQNRRQHMIKDEYTSQFEDADKVYWLPTYLAREKEGQVVLTPQDLTKNLTNKQNVTYAELGDGLWENIQKDLSEGNLVLFMGVGSIDKWAREQLKK